MTSIPQKTCTKCGKSYPATSEFFKKIKRNKSGIGPRCKTCDNADNLKYRGPTDETEVERECTQCHRVFPATPKYFPVNKRYRNGIQTWCHECHRDYHHANKKRQNQINRDNYAANVFYWQRRARTYRRENREEVRMKDRERNKTLKRRVSFAQKAARRAKAPGTFTQADIDELYELQDGHCAYCGIRIDNDPIDYHIDHMHPLVKGGSNWPDNLALACPPCNLSKGDKTLEEWLAVRGW